MKTVYIIEDNDILITLLETFLTSEHQELDLLGISSEGAEAMSKCLELEPDLVIADIGVPEVNGLEILHLLKMKIPGIKVIIFTGRVNAEVIRIATHGHANGIVSKASGIAELSKAIKALASGTDRYISPDFYHLINE